jgi:hypothetical protein
MSSTVKLLIFGLITLGLTSCGPEVGQNVYVGAKGGPTLLGVVVAGGYNRDFSVVRLCDGQTFSVKTDNLIVTDEVCSQ